MATVVWDCAFSEPVSNRMWHRTELVLSLTICSAQTESVWCFQNRIPFVVPERVPWTQMCDALSSKFMSEVQTQRALDRCNLHFLAQKIFDQPDISEDFSNMPVSWAQFNKVTLTYPVYKAYMSFGSSYFSSISLHSHCNSESRLCTQILLKRICKLES